MADDLNKPKSPQHTVDFVTALSPDACAARLERGTVLLERSLGSALAPMRQDTTLLENRLFTVERRYPGNLYPLRLVGSLDPADTGGTWVHGAVTHDAYNQVLVEGLIAFVTFFLVTMLFFLRLKIRALEFTLPLFLIALFVLSLRWRALYRATDDMARWVRRRLYLTSDQLRANERERARDEDDLPPSEAQPQQRRSHRG